VEFATGSMISWHVTRFFFAKLGDESDSEEQDEATSSSGGASSSTPRMEERRSPALETVLTLEFKIAEDLSSIWTPPR
jgi:hypothetical protein